MEQHSAIQFSMCRADGSLNWENAPAHPAHPAHDIHVWGIFMDQMAPARIEDLGRLLSQDEIVRAGKYPFEVHRRRFIACRGMLRTVLGCYLRCPATAIEFEYGQWGKPRLAGAATRSSLEFNVAHTEGLALIAVTSGASIGIDIEMSSDRMNVEQIAREFFSPGEVAEILGASPDSRTQLFLRYWTRREAVLKSVGVGLTGLDGNRRLQEMDELSRRCEIRELHPVAAGVAAVARVIDPRAE